uniref:Secreted protein n=1 Tax=Kryptolebias marmoratus TaxID=37003 RepID=A0A3Q3AA83_KRYMA
MFVLHKHLSLLLWFFFPTNIFNLSTRTELCERNLKASQFENRRRRIFFFLTFQALSPLRSPSPHFPGPKH